MAYNTTKTYSGNGNRSFGNKAAGTTPAVAAGTAVAAGVDGQVKTEPLFKTGLWKQPEGSKSQAIATCQVKEDVHIPAGSYINLFATDLDKRTEMSPDFRITVRPGVLRPKK